MVRIELVLFCRYFAVLKWNSLVHGVMVRHCLVLDRGDRVLAIKFMFTFLRYDEYKVSHKYFLIKSSKLLEFVSTN